MNVSYLPLVAESVWHGSRDIYSARLRGRLPGFIEEFLENRGKPYSPPEVRADASTYDSRHLYQFSHAVHAATPFCPEVKIRLLSWHFYFLLPKKISNENDMLIMHFVWKLNAFLQRCYSFVAINDVNLCDFRKNIGYTKCRKQGA